MPLPDPTPTAPHRRTGRRLLAVLGWATTLCLTSLLVFAYALPQYLTDPNRLYVHLAAAAFFGRVLTFQAGLVLTVVALAALALRRRYLAVVTAIVAAVALWPTLAACRPRHPPAAAGRAVRILAMNVKFSNRDAADIIAQVRQFNPDVIALEELGGPPVRALNAALAGDFPFRCLRPHGGVGLGVYSRLPFEEGPPQVSFGRVRRQIRCVVRIDGRPVALYVVHPLSPRSVPRVLFNRLATADLAEQVRREALPVVLAGDFNFTAETPNAAALTGPTPLGVGLTDAFDLAGRGRGTTWPVRPRWAAWLPGVRIDHVYLSPGLTCTRYATGTYDGSDHLPIVADLAVAAR